MNTSHDTWRFVAVITLLIAIGALLPFVFDTI